MGTPGWLVNLNVILPPSLDLVAVVAVFRETGVSRRLLTLVEGNPSPRTTAFGLLAAQLACACVEGYAQRDYQALGSWLQKRLGHEVRVEDRHELAPRLPETVAERAGTEVASVRAPWTCSMTT